MHTYTTTELTNIAEKAKSLALEMGFQQAGIADIELGEDASRLHQWLEAGYHGNMDYMHKHGSKRYKPEQLVPGTLCALVVRMDYLPPTEASTQETLNSPVDAFISRYALGRDYHKLMRQRLQKLATQLTETIPDLAYRVFVDSAPVLEKALARNAGLGWIGKHSNLINRDAGSWFFIGEVYLGLDLPKDKAETSNHCGQCRRCIDICPTQAIIAPYTVDARRCVSYLTIELKESIPEDLRPLMGNRIYGCDDCQWVCPWNRFADFTEESDFHPRKQLDNSELIDLFLWDEETFLKNTEGSAIRRIGHERWLRNIAVGLGNAVRGCSDKTLKEALINALKARRSHPSTLVREHVCWALNESKQH